MATQALSIRPDLVDPHVLTHLGVSIRLDLSILFGSPEADDSASPLDHPLPYFVQLA